MTQPTTDAQRRGLSFGDEVAPNSEADETITLEADATVEKLRIRIYPGARLDLRVRPLVRTQSGNEYELVELEGKSYVDGDDDIYEWSLAEPVSEGDEIVMETENVNQNNAYDYRADVELEHAGGLSRVLSALGGGA